MDTQNITNNNQLAIALAINRGIEFLADPKNFNKDISGASHNASIRGSVLRGLYFQIHEHLFKDTEVFSKVKKSVSGEAETSSPRRIQARDAINELANSLYNESGTLKITTKDDALDAFSQAYFRLHEASPFETGNDLALRLFFCCLTKLPEIENMFDSRIDFSRIDDADIEILRNPQSAAELHRVFQHAWDANRMNIQSSIQGQNWHPWDDKRVRVGGLDFLHEVKDGVDYLITVNGGMVRRDVVEPQLLEYLKIPGVMVNDFTIPTSSIERYIDDDNQEIPDYQKLRNKKTIDGINVREKVSLYCTDVNPLTGLSKAHHKTLKDYLQANKGDGDWLFQLNDKAFAASVMQRAESINPNIVPLLTLAITHVQAMVPILDKAIDDIFVGKTPAAKKHFVMSMGGGGSGKSATNEMMKNLLQQSGQANDNFVEASLDKSREVFDHYHVMARLGHLADDYSVVEDAANVLRNNTSDRALHAGYNVLFDGSGIPYNGRYDALAKQYKGKGYETHVVGTDCMLYIPQERKKAFGSSIPERVIARYESEKRALQWSVVVDRHIKFPLSFIKSVEDANMDHVSLVDNAGEAGKNYIMARTYEVDDDTLKAIRKAKDSKTLLPTLKKHNLIPANNPNAPALEEDNINFIEKRVGKTNRILVVYNESRFLDTVQKGHMNTLASTIDKLVDVNKDSAFLVPKLDTPEGIPADPGRLWLQRTDQSLLPPPKISK